MKKYLLLLVLALLLNGVLAQDSMVFGMWKGTFKSNKVEIDMYFNIVKKEGKDLCYLSIPQQMLKNVKATKIEMVEDSISIFYAMFNASYDGHYNAEMDKIEGQWTQGIASELNLMRTEGIEEVKRPQEPKLPFDYIAKDVTFENPRAGIKLAGTLTLPDTVGKYPAAILVSGSGPQNRDEELFDHKPFLVIADYLTKKGFAVLRYDDRGIGQSEGSFLGATTMDFADDAAAAYEYLLTRKEINKDFIGIIGHSEGGMVAPVVANQHKNVGFLILLAGPGEPIPDLMTKQNVNIYRDYGFTDEELKANESYNAELFRLLATDTPQEELYEPIKTLSKDYYNSLPDTHKPLFGPTPETYYISLASQAFSTWFRGFIQFDVKKYLVNIKCPVLALNGSRDFQVPSKSNLAGIENALTEGGNKDFKILELEGLNHLFQKCNLCTLAEYGELEETFSEDVLKIMADWLQSKL